MMSLFEKLSINDCSLQQTRIDLWQYPLNLCIPDARSLLSDEEKSRADRFYFPHHQRRFTQAHAVLRLILSLYLKTAAQHLRFSATQHGKPELNHPQQLQFNLSHSEESALLAVGQHYPLGVDLEHFSARPYSGISSHLFAEAEQRALNSSKSSLIPLLFFTIWAQKEAFIKACGLGLSYPTQKVVMPMLSYSIMPIQDTLHQRTWHMQTFIPTIACCGALCHDPSVQSIRYCRVDNPLIETLLKINLCHS